MFTTLQAPPDQAPGEPNGKGSRADELGKRAIWTSIAIGLIACVVYAVQSTNAAQFTSVLAVSVVIAGAGAVSGALLGFLFGIPRAMQHDAPIPRSGELSNLNSAASEPKSQPLGGYLANTNLEQISDWLTKILVGVGLTQVRSIPDALTDYANATAPALGGFDASGAFSIGLLVYYLVVGFVIGYLLTRLYLPGAFRQADLASIGSKVEKLAEKIDDFERQNQIDARALGVARRQLERAQDVEPPTQDQLNEAILPASASIKAQIFDMARAMRRDNWKSEETKGKMERTIPIFRALIAADMQGVYHRNHGQLGFALKDQRQPDLYEAQSELTKAIELRGPSKIGEYGLYELNRAICRVHLDPSFASKSPSSDDVKAAISADLQVTAMLGRPWLEELVKKRVPELDEWMTLNKVSLDSLAPAEA